MGILEDVGMKVKFIYDHVFEPHADNRSVYKTVASPIVQSALDGINGTVFACAPAARLLGGAALSDGCLAGEYSR